jgi:hypothetical protein
VLLSLLSEEQDSKHNVNGECGVSKTRFESFGIISAVVLVLCFLVCNNGVATDAPLILS